MSYILKILLLVVFFSQSASALDVYTERDIEYSMLPIYQRKLDIYRPKGDFHHLPVIVYVHSELGSDEDKADSEKAGQLFASHGAVFVSVNYRTGGDHRMQDQPDDLAASLNWVKRRIKEYGGRDHGIILIGPEDGGWLIAQTALDDGLLKKYTLSEEFIKLVVPANTGLFDLNAASYAAKGEDARLINDKFGDTESRMKYSPTHSPLYLKGGPEFMIFTAEGDKNSQIQAETFIKNYGGIAQSISFKAKGIYDELIYGHDGVRAEIYNKNNLIAGMLIDIIKKEIDVATDK